MNAHEIRNILNAEVINLQSVSHLRAAIALNEFAASATDAELIRFREILIDAEPANTDWANDPNSVTSHFHY